MVAIWLGSIYRNTVSVKKCAETANWKSDDWHRLLVCHIAWRAQRAMQCGTTKAVYRLMETNLWHRLLVCHIAWRAQRAMQCGTTKAVYRLMETNLWHRLLVCRVWMASATSHPKADTKSCLPENGN